jgi:hypothetical protein
LACRWEKDENGKMKFIQLNKDLDYVHGQDEDKYVPLECPAGLSCEDESLLVRNLNYLYRTFCS